MQRFFSELRRRHVFRVAAAYGVVAWLLIQVAATTFPILELPAWSTRLVLILVLLGFPVALVLAWAFEVTPEGVRRAEPIRAGEGGARRGGSRLDSRAAGWAGVGIVVGLTTVGAYGWVRMPGPAAEADAGALRTVAVLPFASVGGGAENEYFSDGITEELLNALSQVPQLRVAARTSAFSFKGRDVGLDSVARALSVEHVLEGSVRAAGDRVRITARLVDASTGHPLWSRSYDREAKDVLAVQEEIAVAIANALQVELAGGDGARLTRSRTADPEAYEFYLQGRHLANQRTKESLQQAIGRFEAALERDPAFAAAYSGLADAYALLEDQKGLPRELAFPKAVAAAQRALELDDLQAEAHASLGHIFYHQKEWSAAEKEYQRAIALNPSYATAHHWYAVLLLGIGRPEDAVKALDRAHELDPLSPRFRELRGWLMYFARRYDEAVAWQREQLEADPNNHSLLYWMAWMYTAAGNHVEAIATMQRLLDLVPPGDPGAASYRTRLAAAYAAAGRREEASRLLQELERIPDEANESVMAVAYGYLGDLDRAFPWLERAVEREHWMVGFLRVDPALDPLRRDPRFGRIVQQWERRSAGPAANS